MWLGTWLALAAAAPLGRVSVQGAMSESGAVVEGPRSVTFRIYAASAGGSSVWQDTFAVTFEGGAFTVELGAGAPLDLALFGQHPELWFATELAGGLESARVRVNTVPKAAVAENALRLDGLAASAWRKVADSIPWTQISGKPSWATDGYTAGTGLTLDDGVFSADDEHIAGVAVAVDPIAGLSCADGQVPVWSAAGSMWTCGTPSGGLGAAPVAGLTLTTTASNACGSAVPVGTIRYTGTSFEGCTTNGWQSLGATGSGMTAGFPAVSCSDAKVAGVATGLTWLRPAGVSTAFQGWCDQDKAGGGWTLIARDRLNDGGVVRSTTTAWAPTTEGTAAGDGDYMLGLTLLDAASTPATYEYLVVASGAGALASQFITCTQSQSITTYGRPNDGACAFQDGSTTALMQNGLSMHDNICKGIAFWATNNSHGSWWQGSQFCEATSCACGVTHGAGWGPVFPHLLGTNSGTTPHPARTSTYTTWTFTR